MILNCPKCNAPILKDLESLVGGQGRDFKLAMRCPHCQKDMTIEFHFELVVVIEQQMYFRGKKIENFAKEVERSPSSGIRFLN